MNIVPRVVWLAVISIWTANGLVFAVDEEPVAAVSETTETVFRNAMKSRYVVAFVYHGQRRTVEPHALGRAGRGQAALLAWQVSAGLSTETQTGWRVFLADEITELKITDGTFSKRADYHQSKSRGLKTIEVEVGAD